MIGPPFECGGLPVWVAGISSVMHRQPIQVPSAQIDLGRGAQTQGGPPRNDPVHQWFEPSQRWLGPWLAMGAIGAIGDGRCPWTQLRRTGAGASVEPVPSSLR